MGIENADQIRRRRTIGSFDLLTSAGSLFGSYLLSQFLGGLGGFGGLGNGFGGLLNGLIRGGI